MDGCGAGGGAGAQELGVRGVESIARGDNMANPCLIVPKIVLIRSAV